MRRPVARLVFAGLAAAALVSAAQAEGAASRVASMPFAECLALIDEAVAEGGAKPVQLVRTADLRVVRLDAADGFVTIACSRANNRVTLARQVMTADARTTVTR